MATKIGSVDSASHRYMVQAVGVGDPSCATMVNDGVYLDRDARTVRYLPRENWSEPKRPQIRPSEALSLEGRVTLAALDASLVSEFRVKLPLLLDASGDDGVRADFLQQFGKRVEAALGAIGMIAESVRVCNVAVNPPGTRSTGKDFVTHEYVGLHIDNHDRLPLASRRTAIQLMTLNCGRSTRYFHFIDLPVEELAKILHSPLDDPQEDRATACDALKNKFLESYPDYPVTRVALPPGSLYVTTPQDIIHDGAGGNVDADVAFLMLGRYRMS